MQDITVSSLIDYDIVFIGPLGAVVANLYRCRSSDFTKSGSQRNNSKTSAHINSNRLLVINNKKKISSPSLVPTHQVDIQIDAELPKCIDQDTSQIYRILPHEQIIIMKQKKYYHYRYLVYGQSQQQWMDTNMIVNLTEALRTKYSYVYSNIIKASPSYSQAQKILNKQKQWMKQVESKLQSMLQKRKSMQLQIKKQKLIKEKNKRSSIKLPQNITDQLNQNITSAANLQRQQTINIVFYVPAQKHSGYDNYNILYKYKQFSQFYSGVIKYKQVRKKEFKNYFSKIKQTQHQLLRQHNTYLKDLDERIRQIQQTRNQNAHHGNQVLQNVPPRSIFSRLQNQAQIKAYEENSCIGNHNKREDLPTKSFQQYANQEKFYERQEVFLCKKLNFIVVLEGQSFYPYDKEADQFIKKQLALNDITIIKNQKILKVDYLRRVIALQGITEDSVSWDDSDQIPDERQFSEKFSKLQTSSKKGQYTKESTIPYDYFYTTLKQKTPKLLESCQINPYNNSPKFLYNMQHKNIFIFGADIFPTTHTFGAVNYQAHIISANLVQLANIQKQGSIAIKKDGKQQINEYLVEYNGYTSFPIWLDNQNFIKFSHTYTQIQTHSDWNFRKSNRIYKTIKYIQEQNKNAIKTEQKKQIGCFQKCIQNLKRKWLIRKQIQMYYNLKSYGKPFYFFIPEFNQANISQYFVKNHSI